MSLVSQYPLESAIHHNLYRLSLIRAVVIFGQCLALIYFTAFKPLGLAAAEIAWVLAIYASISVATANRGRFKITITNKEFFIHLLVDIIFFSILLYFSGGASNPFISYYLIPISIAAISLPRAYTASIALIALVGYSLLLNYHIPVMAIAPSHMGHTMEGNNLHVLGMWANFAISAAIISYFVSQIASELELQQKNIAEYREQQLENEQLLAIGTLAAGTAHELGTPLNTMRLLVDEMQLQKPSNTDINLLSQQIDQCKITLKQLQSTANESVTNQYSNQTLHSYFDQLIEIKGEVNFPKEIDFRKGYTITDLIILSGGLTPYANKNDIKIFRNVSKSGGENVTEEIIIKLDENLIPNKKIVLQPDDIVTVNTYPYRKNNKFYTIEGELALPGLYSIKNQTYSVYDAIKDNIEFLNSSSIDGISIVRDSIRIPVNGTKLISQGSNSKFNFELLFHI